MQMTMREIEDEAEHRAECAYDVQVDMDMHIAARLVDEFDGGSVESLAAEIQRRCKVIAKDASDAYELIITFATANDNEHTQKLLSVARVKHTIHKGANV